MTEETELQAKIAALSGKINLRKQQQPPPLTPNAQSHQGHPYGQHPARGHARWSPYGRGGRGGRAGYLKPHLNRTLVLGGTPKPTAPASEPVTPSSTPAIDPAAAESFVSARRPGMNQLINKNTYAREQEQKVAHAQRASTAKRQKLDRDERSRLIQYTSNQGSREMIVDGLRFQLRDDGSKLIRVSGKLATAIDNDGRDGRLNHADAQSSARGTPKKVTIADVDFFRTKNGNLVRANAVKDLNRYFAVTGTTLDVQYSLLNSYRQLRNKHKPQCKDFTIHGTHLPIQSGQSVRCRGQSTIVPWRLVSFVHR